MQLYGLSLVIMSITNDVVLKSGRLKLRLIDAFDLEHIHALNCIAEVDHYNTLGIPTNLDETKSIFTSLINDNSLDKKTKYTFAIENRKNHTFMGMFGFNLDREKYQSGEIWYKLRPEFWGQGYATEAVELVIGFGFNDLKLHRIHAGCAVENIGSIRVLEKIGMRQEGRALKTLPLKTGWSDHFNYALLRDEYKNR